MPDPTLDAIREKTKLHLKLDGGQGNILANSGREADSQITDPDQYLDASIVGNVSRIDNGVNDDALRFTDPAGYVTVPDHAAIDLSDESFALNMDLKLDPGASHMIMNTRINNGAGIQLENVNGVLRLTLEDQAGVEKTFDLPANELAPSIWQDVTINIGRDNSLTQDNTTVEFLVDGVSKLTLTDTLTANSSLDNVNPLTIGPGSGLTQGAGFSIDNVRIVEDIINPTDALRLHRSEINSIFQDRVASWSFDESQGSYLADSVGNNDLTRVNDPVTVDGEVDHALLFNGSQSLTANSNAAINFGTSDMTVSALISTTDTDGTIVEKIGNIGGRNQSQAGYSLQIEGGKLTLQLLDGVNDVKIQLTEQKTNQIIDGQWNRVAVTMERDGDSINEVKFFNNGAEIIADPLVSINGAAPVAMSTLVTPANPNAISMNSIDNIGQLVIGKELSGKLDQPEMHKDVLSLSQIEQIDKPVDLVYGANVTGVDTLIAQTQAERFVLGHESKAFNLDQNVNTYSQITNLDMNQDQIVLPVLDAGSTYEYTNLAGGAGVSISVNNGAGLEQIAEVMAVSGQQLDITNIQTVTEFINL